MPVINLTDITLRNLTKPEHGYVIYSDTSLKGFGVRITDAGHRSYVLTYGERRKRVTIGDVGVVKLKDARQKAKDILSEYQLNGDAPKSPYWSEAKEQYIKRHVEKNQKEITQKDTKRLLKRFESLKDKRLADLTPDDLLSKVDKLSPGSANHHFTCVKGFLNWCVAHHRLDRNPLFGIKKPHKTAPRERVLTEDELRVVLATAPSQGKYGEIVLWCLYTLQRRNQIASLRGEYFDGMSIRWPAVAMKGNRPHEIPHQTNQIPDNGLVYPNRRGNPWNAWSKPHSAFLKKSGTSGWNLHDLRRAGSTIMCEKLHISPWVVERILAHKSGTLSPLHYTYNKATYLEEMKEALTAWRQYLLQLQSSGSGNRQPEPSMAPSRESLDARTDIEEEGL
jgi:integrase